jgi:hypothetical protein
MSEDQKPKGLEVGDPIWVESLLNKDEYRACSKKYNTYNNTKGPPQMFDCEFKWRYRMGSSLTEKEIQQISDNIDLMLADAGLVEQTN